MNRASRRLRLGSWLASVLLMASVLLIAAGCGSFGPHIHIDYADFVWHGGIEYGAQRWQFGRVLTDADLGPAAFTVSRSLQESQSDQGGPQPGQDGDAGILPAGTPLYSVKGYSRTFRLAALRSGQVVVYEADTNPAAHTGADLLDIAGKVADIRVIDPTDGRSVLATISQSDALNTLVALVLAAPVKQNVVDESTSRYLLVFDLRDGTAVVRYYGRDTRQLDRGIVTPPAFGTALDQTVSAQQGTPQATPSTAV